MGRYQGERVGATDEHVCSDHKLVLEFGVIGLVWSDLNGFGFCLVLLSISSALLWV